MEPRAVVQAFYGAFDEQPYGTSVARFLAPDVVWHVAGDNPLVGNFNGLEEVLAAMRASGEASNHTLQLNTMTLLADDHHVVAIHDASAATDTERYRAHEVDVFHVRDEVIEAFWSFSEGQQATDRLWSTAQ